MSTNPHNTPAYPTAVRAFSSEGIPTADSDPGMSIWDAAALHAISNPAICTGTAPEYELQRWSGGRGGITREEICAAQAANQADAFMAERAKRRGKK